jgi:hypothetical protein
MPGQKRATPTVERDPTNTPSMAAVATGAASRSERKSVGSFAGCATASPVVLGGVGRRSYPFRPGARPIVRNFLAGIELRRPQFSQLAVAPNDLKLAVARLAFGRRLAGGEVGDFILHAFATVCTFEAVLVHSRIPRQLIRD